MRRLKCVKYELDKISSSVDTLPLRDLIKVMTSGPSEGVHTTRRYSGLGILFDKTLKSYTHCLIACVYHSFTWLAYDYWQPGALLVLTGNPGLLFPKKSVTQSGSITFRRAGFSICDHC